MSKTIKIPQGNDFVAYFPLVMKTQKEEIPMHPNML